MKEVIIRELESDDISRVSEMLLSMWLLHADNSEMLGKEKIENFDINNYLSKALESDRKKFFIAVSGDEIIGTIRLVIKKTPFSHKADKEICLDNLMVLEEQRGKGIGTSLVKRCIQFAKDIGIKEISCNIYEFNDPSRNLVKKLGFKPEYNHYSLNIEE